MRAGILALAAALLVNACGGGGGDGGQAVVTWTPTAIDGAPKEAGATTDAGGARRQEVNCARSPQMC